MTDIASLLTFPSTCNGFTAFRPSIHESHATPSSPQRHKVPRLETDSDSGSASRSRATAQPTSRTHVVASRGPAKVSIYGNLCMFQCPSSLHSILIANQTQRPLLPNARSRTCSPFCGIACVSFSPATQQALSQSRMSAYIPFAETPSSFTTRGRYSPMS
jgi:hypothetical protein